MLFNSFSFLIFFPVVFLVYYLLPNNWRPRFLLAVSCYFYMAFVPKYILVLFFLIVTDYALARIMEHHSGRKRTSLLVVSVAANIGTLFFFKYFNFFNENIAHLGHMLHWNYSPVFLSIALPLGLSFHVFQSLSYVIEVYKGKYKAEKNILTYALYVMFFPQLVAGPIERPEHLLPQFKIDHHFNSQNIRRGLERMLWGFFKKLVIADNIAVIVNNLYAHLPADGPSLILLVVLFSYQLYCDFSGYSDIAVGSALVLGYEITENFNRPYSAATVADFWRQWHISLSNWLRDYLYYPLALGWGKVSKIKLYGSLFLTFVLIGLWHGANWTFVALGALHGAYLVVGSMTEKFRKRFAEYAGLSKVPKFHRMIQVAITFSLVSFSWIFFRAADITQAWAVISHLGNGLGNVVSIDFVLHKLFHGLDLGKTRPAIILLSVICMEIVQYYQAKKNTRYIFDTASKTARYGWYYVLTFAILWLGYLATPGFIYFQF